MVFRWKITRPPFHAQAEGVDVMQPGIEVEFETGSIGEAHGIYTDNKTALGEMFGAEIIGNATQVAEAASEAKAPGEATTEAPVKQRGRGPNKPKPEAVAPAPIAIPGAEAPPTAPVAADNGLPAFLDRTIAAPPFPAAPPAPPTGILAGKIVAQIEQKAAERPDGEKIWTDWLVTSRLIKEKSTYVEAIQALFLMPDEKLGPIAQALGVAA
jgi:hypothetical protein